MQAVARPLTRTAPKSLRRAAALSTWSAVPAGPPDPILGACHHLAAFGDVREAEARVPPTTGNAAEAAVRLGLHLHPRWTSRTVPLSPTNSRVAQVLPKPSRQTKTHVRLTLVWVHTVMVTASPMFSLV